MPKRRVSTTGLRRSKRRKGGASGDEPELSDASPSEHLDAGNSAQAISQQEANGAAAGHQPNAENAAHDEDEVGEEEEEGTEGPGDDSNPSRIPDIQDAAAQLAKLTGIPLDTALTALKETREEVFGSGDAGADGSPDSSSGGGSSERLQDWLEAAQIYLAVRMEVEDEIQDVREAMRESLQEYESAKAADDIPLTQRPADYLADRFVPPAGSAAALAGAACSAVVARLGAFACHRALFAEGGVHKAPLVRLAELECKCRKWYPNRGTGRFWEQLADDLAAAAEQAAPASPALRESGWVACDAGPEGCSTCAAALGQGLDAAAAAAGPSTSAAAAAAPAAAPARVALSTEAAAAVLAVVGEFADLKEPEMQREICKMPSKDGQTPDVFALLDDPAGAHGDDSDSDDLLEVVELGTCNGRKPQDVDAVEV
ncbi:hypothetical protein Agub_g12602 [Astrephomene gubernaculifera]|uniref:Uncharacterized protein n=1 Tax=Astrephomene gubernaculifera TaxID=47775 RepID=A0AAD3E031_9CHLO|nr:hypothetical protein Agub_g12602 [Astrephomene gubernaculifera]